MEAKTLALYLGCQVQFYQYDKWHVGTLVGINPEQYFIKTEGNATFVAHYINTPKIKTPVKLLLRPLSSMTEKEIMETKWPLTFSKWGPYTPEQFQYLLSKGFDLFGLIEKGEAIDSTKL